MKHRTAIITAASIAVVIAAATAAIATNLGILDNATAASDVGALTIETAASAPATNPATTPAAQIVVVADDAASEGTENAAPVSTGELAAYAVGDAAIVTLSNDGQALTVVDVSTSPGWETSQILSGASVDIVFVNADGASLQFTAELDATGGIVTAVNDLSTPETVVITETVYEDGTPATSGTYEDDDDDRYENDDNKGDDDGDRYENEDGDNDDD